MAHRLPETLEKSPKKSLVKILFKDFGSICRLLLNNASLEGVTAASANFFLIQSSGIAQYEPVASTAPKDSLLRRPNFSRQFDEANFPIKKCKIKNNI